MKRFAGIAILALATTFGMAQNDKTGAGFGVNAQGSQKITNGPVIEYVSDHSAVVSWSTSKPSGSYVAYGTNQSDLNQKAAASWGGTNHRVELKNLTPGTVYYFQVRSENAASGGNGADVESPVASFATGAKGTAPDRHNRNVGVNGPQSSTPAAQAMPQSDQGAIAQITNGPVLEYVSDHDAVVAWTSKSGSDMQVKYGTDQNNLTQTADASENSRGSNHRVKLNSLQPSTTYFLQMEQNGQPVGSVVSFQTVAKGAAPNRRNINLGIKK